MERSTRTNGLINLALLLVACILGFTFAGRSNSIAGEVCAIFLAIGTLVAAVSWFQMRLEENERLEKLEFDELKRSKGASTLFETKDTEGFPAQHSREQFEKYLVPAFTVFLLVAETIAVFLLWRWFTKNGSLTELKEPIPIIVFFGIISGFCFVFGIFSAALTRLENHRLLRPSAGWLLLNSFLSLVVAAGAAAKWMGYPRVDMYAAEALTVLLGLVALETLVGLVLEIYRPRVKGKVSRPLYESRVVGLLGQPGGLFRTAAETLDYQFGFKVSETWFYRYLVDNLPLLVLLQLAALFVSTMVVFVSPGEQALLEHLGARATMPLGPGGHLKWPWPIDRVYPFRTEQIQTLIIGSQPDPSLPDQTTILWTVNHLKEENFLVAKSQADSTVTNDATVKTPPVSLLTVSIPVQFQITNVLDWAYNNVDATNLLQNLATREVVRYLASADFTGIMSAKRGAAADELKQRIQAAVDNHAMGADILFVGLQDIHPPQKVAGDFEKVVSAAQTKLATILSAEADDIKTNALAAAAATNIIDSAEGDATRTVVKAYSKAALFTNQIPAYEAAPDIYMERTLLQTFVSASANARKYVLLATNTHDILQFDLQDKIRADLAEDLTVSTNR